MIGKYTYYLDFTTTEFLSCKEILKKMPVVFNNVYFCKKYANALWSGEKEEHFKDITMICRMDAIANIRQIIKNNFLHIQGWDSLKYSGNEDYGFSFIAGNIKFTLMPFIEVEDGYIIKSYDTETTYCSVTTIKTDKKFFLDISVNENGEFVRTCAFDVENMNESNTTKKLPPKMEEPKLAVYEDNKGHALANANYVIGIIVLLVILLWLVLIASNYLG